MAPVTLHDICKSHQRHAVIQGIDLDTAHGELVVFIGPSGCGESALLRMIAGLEPISSGDMLIDGPRANDQAPVELAAGEPLTGLPDTIAGQRGSIPMGIPTI
jgi:ABC-type sugar transport system ATPase subunit